MRFSLLRRTGIYSNVCGWISEKRIANANRRMMSRWSPVLMMPSIMNDKLVYNFHGHGEESKELLLPDPDNAKGVQLAGSSHGWLALYNWVNDDVFLTNPLTRRNVKLPPLHTLPDPKFMNLQAGVSRVALSDEDVGSEVCRAMMTVGPASRLAFCVPGRSTEWTPIGDLYCERQRYDDYRHGTIRETCSREYEDVVYSRRRKLFYCITRFATELEGWNVGDSTSPRLDWRVPHNEELDFEHWKYHWPSLEGVGEDAFDVEAADECWHLKYLVFAEERDELFLVVRHVNPRASAGGALFEKPIYYSKFRGCDYTVHYKTVAFDVYKIDEKGKLRYMDRSLEGMAMFVGINHSCAVSESELMRPNTIYFTDDNHLMRRTRSDVLNLYGGHDIGIFDYEKKCHPCSHCCPSGDEDHYCYIHRCALDASSVYDHVERFDPPPLWFFHFQP